MATSEIVREEHLLPISDFIVNWERVAIYLGLSAVDIEAIKQNDHTYEIRKYKVLLKWRNRNVGTATYQCLIEKAKRNSDAGLAREIEYLLGETYVLIFIHWLIMIVPLVAMWPRNWKFGRH